MGEEQVNGEAGSCSEASTMEDPMLQQALDVISSLITLTYNVRVFSGKWTVIRAKLEELNAGLQAAENCRLATTSSTSLLNLVETILQTLGRCHDLASQCVNISYCGGKLLMQSDLDLAFAKLDAHIRTLSGVYAAGVLSNGFAIVVSRPGPASSRDDLRFYVRDLATRMKIGDSDMKRQALCSLHEVVMESEKSVGIAMEKDEILCMLPRFLDSPETEIQEESARVASVICGFDSYKSSLVAAGIIPPLIRVSEGGSMQGKYCAVKCLLKLTENSDNAWSVAAHGGVNILLKCCTAADGDSELISSACGVLRNLVGVEEIKRFMVEEGAIRTFINLVRAGDDSTRISSIELLQAMAYGDESLGNDIVAQGGAQAMISSGVDPNSSSSYKAREAAVKAVESLCFSSPGFFQMLVSCGFVDHILCFLRSGEAPLQEVALKAAVRLCGASEEARKVMGESGFIPALVSFLQAKSCEVRCMASEAISSLLALPRNRKRFLKEDKNLGAILQMLDDCHEQRTSRQLQLLLSILLALSSYSSGVRRRILASACFSTLDKLAQSGVHDAKKIITKLSSNRFQGMVSRILHLHG